MIVREIVTRTKEVLANFDYFNDYKDTRRWLLGSQSPMRNELIDALDDGFNIWLKEQQKEFSG